MHSALFIQTVADDYKNYIYDCTKGKSIIVAYA